MPTHRATRSRAVRWPPSAEREHPDARRQSDHRERLWDRARKIAPHHLRFFSKHRKRFCGTRNEGRFLSAAPWTVFLWNDPQARRRVNVAFGHYEDVRAVCSEEFLPKTFATAELDLANVYS